MDEDYYLRIGRASDIRDKKERIIFRFFEILPGTASWGVLFLAIFLSWRRPFWVAVFIIVFVIFWFFRTVYFSFCLWTGYRKMAKNEEANWIEKLNKFPISLDRAKRETRGPDESRGGWRGGWSPRKVAFQFPIKNWREVYHLIVIPMYKESLEIVRDNFKSLIKTDYPKYRMFVVLACEEKVKNFAQEIAKEVEKEFGSKFLKFMITWHPANLAGEISGKGSNETWAAKKAKEKIIDPLKIPYENIIFSSFDVDTCVFPKYFSCLTYHYLTSEKPTKTSFQPVALFINNIWQAPVISRVFSFSSTFWHTINQERPEKLVTFSSHSMSFKALVDVGFKQTNVVSDDSRIFWQCFLKYNGDYQVKPLYYPISMDANVARNFFKTLTSIYKQQRRWAYGVGDIPYFLFGFLKNKKIPLSKKLSLGFEIIEGHFSWATFSILIFLLGWLPLILGGHQFSQTLMSYNLPKVISRTLTFSMVGLVSSAYLSFLLLPPKPPKYGRWKYLVFAFGWLLFPIMMIFFTAFPALEAQTHLMFGKYMGFWPTEKVRKK